MGLSVLQLSDCLRKLWVNDHKDQALTVIYWRLEDGGERCAPQDLVNVAVGQDRDQEVYFIHKSFVLEIYEKCTYIYDCL